MNRYRISRHRGLSLALVLLIGLSLPACDSLDVTDPNAPNANDVTIQSLVSGVEGARPADQLVEQHAPQGSSRHDHVRW